MCVWPAAARRGYIEHFTIAISTMPCMPRLMTIKVLAASARPKTLAHMHRIVRVTSTFKFSGRKYVVAYNSWKKLLFRSVKSRQAHASKWYKSLSRNFLLSMPQIAPFFKSKNQKSPQRRRGASPLPHPPLLGRFAPSQGLRPPNFGSLRPCLFESSIMMYVYVCINQPRYGWREINE